MRLSTALIQQRGVNAILDQQSKLHKTQLQLATGKRNLTPADDPSAAVQSLDLGEEIRKHTQYQDNIRSAQNRLSLEEDTLANATDVLQRIRELAVRANNEASLRPEDRSYIAKEVRQGLDQLVGLANTKNANGEYLFAGTKSHTQPYSAATLATDGYYKYQGDANHRLIQIGPTRRLADGDPGSSVFENVETARIDASPEDITEGTPTTAEVQKIPVGALTPGATFELEVDGVKLSAGPMDKDPTLTELATALNAAATALPAPFTVAEGLGNDAGKLVLTWSSPGNVNSVAQLRRYDNTFSAIDQFAKALEGGLDGNSAKRLIGDSLLALDNALEKINTTRASIGARLNAIDNQKNVNEAFVVDIKTTLSEVDDLDYAEAIGRFNLQQVALQAAQQAFAKVQNLSLFNYIR
ncbi:flagellar hook-associated protein 3 FlgL [Methylomarinovum caldicuralii]|uniref:Flagellar hook-associated protein 3 FlgL n=1 Tax=Methylomarinovum caldicuralii TaxID=438856 RepID=A0AAU9C2E4_9GAMM|nr:flagellar hook-associated protein FlgL [Methylomarinovum caldicuralii]BCX82930.1 flagellar hook-associated protein 3 FlgL [Methylomarinovum caldicuralii]